MFSKMQNSIVLYPAPEIGHVMSMVEFGKLILQHSNHQFSIKILLITSDFWDTHTITSYFQNVSQTLPLISFVRFPFVSVDTTPTRSGLAMAFDCIRVNASNALRSLQEISKTSKISALLIDVFCTSALFIGKDLGIPTYYFYTSGAAYLGAFLYLEKVHQEHTTSFKDLKETFLHFPTMPPLKAIHMPEPVLDRCDPAYDDYVYFSSCLKRSDGIIVNTFEELEPKAVRIIADGSCVVDGPTPPVYYIGPLIAARSEAQHDCLSWLQKQPSKSVVFLCFGSRGSFTREQVEEIAKGLERSEQRFLWVIKSPPHEDKSKQLYRNLSDFDLNELLPDGFLDRVKDKGMVVKPWAPQVAVLSQESVGGFVTHCGWNSVLEAVVAGVPMVAWPLYAEQHMNRSVLVEDMKMAIGVDQRDEDNFVSADEVERSVRELMDSDKGRELRERSWKMRERAIAALQKSGSSTKALSSLIQIWKQC